MPFVELLIFKTWKALSASSTRPFDETICLLLSKKVLCKSSKKGGNCAIEVVEMHWCGIDKAKVDCEGRISMEKAFWDV